MESRLLLKWLHLYLGGGIMVNLTDFFLGVMSGIIVGYLVQQKRYKYNLKIEMKVPQIKKKISSLK